MNKFAKTLSIMALAASATSTIAFQGVAEARQISITAIQNEGFRACRAQGRSGYTALIRGKLYSAHYGVRGGTDNFTIRYCVPTRSQCERFISRVSFTVRDIDRIRSAKCSPR